HARRLPELALGTPEATESEDRGLVALGERAFQRRVEHVVPRGDEEGTLGAARQRLVGGGQLGLVTPKEHQAPLTSVGIGASENLLMPGLVPGYGVGSTVSSDVRRSSRSGSRIRSSDSSRMAVACASGSSLPTARSSGRRSSARASTISPGGSPVGV